MEDAFSDFKRWYFSKPLVTRSYLAIAFLLSTLVSLGIVSPFSLTYTFKQGIMDFQLWRIFTAGFFMGKFSFGLLFQLYFAYMFLSKTQTEIFSKETYADFLWLIMFLFGSLIIITSIIPTYIYSNAFLMALTYIYCKRRPFQQFRLMFGFVVKSGYFPFVWAALKALLMGQSFVPLLIGLGLGHLFIFLKDIYVVRTHKDYLGTPNFINKWWNGSVRLGGSSGEGRPNQANNPFAGTGVRIG